MKYFLKFPLLIATLSILTGWKGEDPTTFGLTNLSPSTNLVVAKIVPAEKHPKEITGNETTKKLIERYYKNLPEKMKTSFPSPIDHIASIDLDSDGKNEYLVGFYKKEKNNNLFPGLTECLYDSDYSFKRCDVLSHVYSKNLVSGFSYRYFVQLDQDPYLELILINGDEDHGDYSIQKLNPTNWKYEPFSDLAFSIFKPGSKKTEISHAYPWWIKDLPITDSLQVYASLNHCDGVGRFEPTTDFWRPKVVFNGVPGDRSNKPRYKPDGQFFGPNQLYTLPELKLEIEKKKAILACQKNSDCKVVPFSKCHFYSVNKNANDLSCFPAEKEVPGEFPCQLHSQNNPPKLEDLEAFCNKKNICSYKPKKN